MRATGRTWRWAASMVTAAVLGAVASTLVFNPGVFAAIANRIVLGEDDTFVNQSVSFDSVPGRQASFRPVPAGRYWDLQTMRATNCESAPRPMEFLLVDQDGTTHAVLSMAAANPVTVAPGGTLSWHGHVTVPPGWRVTSRWHDMAGGARCNWQYTAVEHATRS